MSLFFCLGDFSNVSGMFSFQICDMGSPFLCKKGEPWLLQGCSSSDVNGVSNQLDKQMAHTQVYKTSSVCWLYHYKNVIAFFCLVGDVPFLW